MGYLFDERFGLCDKILYNKTVIFEDGSGGGE